MKITKITLDPMEFCYCASSLTIDGRHWAVLAGEMREAPCYAYAAPDYKEKMTLWDSVGGTMSLIQIPNTNGEFLAVRRFYPVFQSAQAVITWGRLVNGAWELRDVLALPYVHRFDILEAGGVKYFFGATLCTSKKEQEDWSDPGALYVGRLPEDLSQGISVRPIQTGLTRNHGYCRGVWKGRQAAFTTCDSGVYVSLPPQTPEGEWTVEQLMDRPVSDIAALDIDGDGEVELATIEPFHGNSFQIYKQKNGQWEKAYTYENPIEFAHAIWGGEVLGKPTFICGVRRKECEIFAVTFDSEQGFVTSLIDKGAGSSNVAVFTEGEQTVLVSANHTANEAAVYLLEKE